MNTTVTKYYRKGDDKICKVTGTINKFGDLVYGANPTRDIPEGSYYDTAFDVYRIINKDMDDEIEELEERRRNVARQVLLLIDRNR